MMKLTITINMNGGGEPTASAQVIDLPAAEVFGGKPVVWGEPGPEYTFPQPKLALPKPRAFWKLSALDLAVTAGTVVGVVWLFS